MPAKGQDIVGTSIFLAKLIGPFALVLGLALLINAAGFRISPTSSSTAPR